jgi:AbrB family looped-hinge helix DNA binding protein
LSEVSVKVTRKGQVTIPAPYRRKLHIEEGTKLIVSQDNDAIIMRPVPELEDLAGIHANKVSLEEMRRDLDKMRMEDRY